MRANPSPAPLRQRSVFILDLDGVVYAGDQAIPGAAEALKGFRSQGKRIAFLTNNSRLHPRAIRDKLENLGVPCRTEDVMTSGHAAAAFVAEEKPDRGQGVFAVGTEHLRAMLVERGVALASPEECGALVVGFDPGFEYSAIQSGLTALLRGVPFIACNRDAHYPGAEGRLFPGCGAMVGALEGASLRKPDFEIGKPSPWMLDALLARLGAAKEDCLYFGDTLEVDVLMAKRAGIPSVWISASEESPRSGLEPELTARSLGEAAKLLGL